MSDDLDFQALLPVFLEEGYEHVENLNLSLLAMERDSTDRDAVNEAFRSAHSIKGMAASMGFHGVTALTHELEAVLAELRSRPDALGAAGFNTMLIACDVLTTLLNEIEADQQEHSTVDHVIADLVERSRVLTDRETPPPSGDAIDVTARLKHVHAALVGSQRIVELRVEVSERSLMPGARAYASLRAIDRVSHVVHAQPSAAVLETGLYEGRTLAVWAVIDAADIEPVLEHAALTREVASVTVNEWSPAHVQDGAIAGENPEVELSAPVARIDERAATTRRGKTVRVDSHRLDELMHGVEELLVRRSRVQTLISELDRRDLNDAVLALDRAARELQGLVMDVRMVSVDSVLRMLPRLTRDLCGELGKEVRINISGRDTELDRTVVDVLNDPLVHLVRNALDHGIEMPDQREAAGKPRVGVIDVAASTEGGNVVIRVRDDGQGMNPDHIRTRALERGVISSATAASMTDEQALDLCFWAGFSTREAVNRISGRGVGLDVVRSSVRSLGGDVTAESSDEGTVMTIRLPLTLAIRSVLLVRVREEIYAFHTDRVGLTLDLGLHQIHEVAGRHALLHLGSVVPLVELASLLEMSGAGDRAHAVLLETSGGTVGVIVDEVVGQAEVVTRALPASVGASDMLSASAVLGDGEVAFLLDTETVGARAEREGLRHVTS